MSRLARALLSAGMDVTLIVDGANVMGSRADGWWRDRAGAMARLHGELAALAAHGVAGPVPGVTEAADGAAEAGTAGSAGEAASAGEAEGSAGEAAASAGRAEGSAGEAAGGRWFPQVYLVVEGRARAVLDLVEPAPRVRVVAARGEGDDEIASLAGRLTGRRVVVTADRELRRRCEAAGAAVAGPGWLIRQFG
jgi:8-oxo-dGTP diphosphatase